MKVIHEQYQNLVELGDGEYVRLYCKYTILEDGHLMYDHQEIEGEDELNTDQKREIERIWESDWWMRNLRDNAEYNLL